MEEEIERPQVRQFKSLNRPLDDLENMLAHGITARVRMEKYEKA